MGWGLNTPDFAKLLQPAPVVFLTFHTRPVFTTNDAFADVSAAKAALCVSQTWKTKLICHLPLGYIPLGDERNDRCGGG